MAKDSSCAVCGDSGSLGFAVMQSFMDRVKVTSRPGKGTKVLLVKRLSRREPT